MGGTTGPQAVASLVAFHTVASLIVGAALTASSASGHTCIAAVAAGCAVQSLGLMKTLGSCTFPCLTGDTDAAVRDTDHNPGDCGLVPAFPRAAVVLLGTAAKDCSASPCCHFASPYCHFASQGPAAAGVAGRAVGRTASLVAAG